MNRRDSLKRISSFITLAASFPALAGVLEGCGEKKPPVWAPLNLTGRQRDILGAVSDAVIPPTDTPGAVDAGVPGFIEVLLKDVFPAEEARALLSELESFDRDCKTSTGKEFSASPAGQQQEWLEKVAKATNPHHAFFMKIRELVVGAYFTSEKGMKQALQYVPIPEKFKGCIPAGKSTRIMVGNRL